MSTKIEWTDQGETWNPIAGCSKISDGCKNCYAIKDAVRLSGNPNPKIADKYRGTTKTDNGKMNWTGQINLASDDVLTQPIRWTRPRKIFVNSMSDLFHENVPDEWIDKIFAVMALSPQHIFQILTKRPERMRSYLLGRSEISMKWFHKAKWIYQEIMVDENPERFFWDYSTGRHIFPLPNVWLGVSVENQQTADERIPLLLETPAAIRFLSCEPLLGEIDFKRQCPVSCDGECGQTSPYKLLGNTELDSTVDWVIVGGESGQNARPCNIDWIRSIVQQCKEADVPVFVKQLGSGRSEYSGAARIQPTGNIKDGQQGAFVYKHKKGGDISEFPEDLRVREFPII